MEKIRVGIDLGTTNTLVCYMKGGKPTLIRFPGGKMLPSILYLEADGTVLIGEAARKKGVYDPLNCIRSSKTEMGNFKKTWTLRGHKFTPSDVAQNILKAARNGIIKRLKVMEDVEIEAIITVPAYFTSNQIDETKRAGEKAGFHVLGIVTEPRAAAIANIQELEIRQQKILVVDLGGGTFDVSVLEAGEQHYRTLVVDGDRKLGGDDFDEKLFQYLIGYIEDDLGIDLSTQEASGLSYSEYYTMTGRVREAACEAKIDLSDEESYEVNIPNLFPYKNEQYLLNMTIARETFYEVCADLFERINSRILRIFQGKKSLDVSDIGRVILAGGSCYIPKIREDVEKMFGVSADTTMDRSMMVAVGACFLADTWDGISSGETDIISHSLGVQVLEGKKLVLEKMLERGEAYPCSKKKIFTTSVDNQESVKITIYEAGSDKEDVREIWEMDEKHNRTVVHDLYGSFELNGIQRAKKGTPKIEVTFEYDRSRLLTVKARDLMTNVKATVTVTKGMTAEETSDSIQMVDFELLVDTSGSMRGEPLRQAKMAGIRLATHVLNLEVHRLGIVGFGEAVKEFCPLTHNKDLLVEAIERLQARGGTSMDEAIRLGVESLHESTNRKVLMVVTDGAPVDRKRTSREAKRAVEQGCDLLTIAAGENADKRYLASIASCKDYAFSVENMQQLSEIFEAVVEKYLSNINT